MMVFLLLVYLATACNNQRHASAISPANESLRLDSSGFNTGRPYRLNTNFVVETDTLWLKLLPLADSLPVFRDDRIVVAEVDIHSSDTLQTVWVKVARDQETIGWISERDLLAQVVPADPISQCIHWFSNSHVLPFLLVLAVFFLWFAYRKIRCKQIKLVGLNDIDSIFPTTLAVLMAVAATLYNSIQHFFPQLWEAYYYHPTLNPFQLPVMLGLFVFCVGMILLVGVAVLDDLFHQAKLEVALFYLTGLLSCCIFLYIFFTYLWIYLAYPLLLFFVYWCVHRMWNCNRYMYVCGRCGAKLQSKGVCPHCGALNE